MLLIEATINGTLRRISMEGIALAHYWDNRVISFDPPQLQASSRYGGYVKPGFGSIGLSLELFSDAADWPPPVEISIAAYYTATDEASKELLFSGEGHLRSTTREAVNYDLYGASYSATVADATAFDDTLANVASWFCDAARLNLTLDTTYARDPSPDVKFTVSGEQIAVNLLSEICAFFTHLFYISGSTLCLVDMLADAGSETITEFDFFPSEYTRETPTAIVRSDNYARTSAYPYGDEISLATEYVDSQAKIEAALDNILTVLNKAGCRLKRPLVGSMPNPGKKIAWTDTSLQQDLDAYIRCRALRYDFDNEEVIIEGEGELS